MEVQRASGLIIGAGFLLYVAAMLVAPQLYQTSDIVERMAIITANQSRWNVSQLLFALGIGVPATGFFLLALSQRTSQTAWLFYLGSAALAAGAALGMWLVLRQTQDPAAFWQGTQATLIAGYGYIVLTLAGLFCVGLAILQAELPDWLGYLLGGSAAVLLLATLLLRGQLVFFTSVIAYLVTFIGGLVIWRQ